MEVRSSSEISVITYSSTRCHNTENCCYFDSCKHLTFHSVILRFLKHDWPNTKKATKTRAILLYVLTKESQISETNLIFLRNFLPVAYMLLTPDNLIVSFKKRRFIKCEVIPTLVFWDVMLCELVRRYQYFGGAYCLHFQSWNIGIYLQVHKAL
jgi:hypothetical protein